TAGGGEGLRGVGRAPPGQPLVQQRLELLSPHPRPPPRRRPPSAASATAAGPACRYRPPQTSAPENPQVALEGVWRYSLSSWTNISAMRRHGATRSRNSFPIWPFAFGLMPAS